MKCATCATYVYSRTHPVNMGSGLEFILFRATPIPHIALYTWDEFDRFIYEAIDIPEVHNLFMALHAYRVSTVNVSRISHKTICRGITGANFNSSCQVKCHFTHYVIMTNLTMWRIGFLEWATCLLCCMGMSAHEYILQKSSLNSSCPLRQRKSRNLHSP